MPKTLFRFWKEMEIQLDTHVHVFLCQLTQASPRDAGWSLSSVWRKEESGESNRKKWHEKRTGKINRKKQYGKVTERSNRGKKSIIHDIHGFNFLSAPLPLPVLIFSRFFFCYDLSACSFRFLEWYLYSTFFLTMASSFSLLVMEDKVTPSRFRPGHPTLACLSCSIPSSSAVKVGSWFFKV